jgi:hypothetical protein
MASYSIQGVCGGISYSLGSQDTIRAARPDKRSGLGDGIASGWGLWYFCENIPKIEKIVKSCKI